MGNAILNKLMNLLISLARDVVVPRPLGTGMQILCMHMAQVVYICNAWGSLGPGQVGRPSLCPDLLGHLPGHCGKRASSPVGEVVPADRAGKAVVG